MGIPDYQSIMLPMLKTTADGKLYSLKEATATLADAFHLTDEERNEMLPSGKQATFNNRVGWAKTYLIKAGLLQSPKRGVFEITDRGKEALAKNPQRIDMETLKQYPEFLQFRSLRHEEAPELDTPVETPSGTLTPEETLDNAYQSLRYELASEILEIVKKCSPAFFERLVVDLLINMNYGGSRKEAGQALGKTGDEGIDGIIKEDRLGLDVIYLQAKRWEGVVGRPEIQRFAGALQGQRATKGVFITTSNFSKEAIAYAAGLGTKIILIGGQQLSELMIDFNVGVAPVATYEMKKIDSDYFTEE